MEQVKEKTCNKCGELKTADCFHKSKQLKDGLVNACKSCVSIERKAYYEKNQERIKQKAKDYYALNFDKCRERMRDYAEKNSDELKEYHKKYRKDNKARFDAYFEENRDAIQAKRKAYREKNKEKRKEAWKRWAEANKTERARRREENKEKILARARELYHKNKDRYHEYERKYREQNREKARVRGQKWTESNPEKARAKYGRRRAAKRMLPATLAPHEWLDCLNSFSNSCAYCGNDKSVLHQEHVIAQLHGGAYAKNNIVPACVTCNSSKGTKPMISWYVRRRYFDSQRLEKILNYLYGDSNATVRTVATTPFPVNRQPPRESIF